MPLLSVWKSNRGEVLKMSVEQIVSIAGDGNLRDYAESSEELRLFFNAVPSERLFTYARHCLDNSFNKSGPVLQDILNELGRRLDFDVEKASIKVGVTQSVSMGFGVPIGNRIS
jgi:hypothetical protein